MNLNYKKNKSYNNDKEILVTSSPSNRKNNNSNKNVNNKLNNKFNSKLNNSQDDEILLKNNNNNKDQQKPAVNDLLFKYFFKLDKEASKRGFTEYGSDNEKESNENKFIMGSPVLIKKTKKIQKQEIY